MFINACGVGRLPAARNRASKMYPPPNTHHKGGGRAQNDMVCATFAIMLNNLQATPNGGYGSSAGSRVGHRA